MEMYTQTELDILAKVANLSLRHGPVELRITEKDFMDPEGKFTPTIFLRSAPQEVVQDLMEDKDIGGMAMKNGKLQIIPASLLVNKAPERG